MKIIIKSIQNVLPSLHSSNIVSIYNSWAAWLCGGNVDAIVWIFSSFIFLLILSIYIVFVVVVIFGYFFLFYFASLSLPFELLFSRTSFFIFDVFFCKFAVALFIQPFWNRNDDEKIAIFVGWRTSHLHVAIW